MKLIIPLAIALLACNNNDAGNSQTQNQETIPLAQSKTVAQEEQKVINITVDELLEKDGKFDGIILDVRTMGEVSEGLIPNAINIDFYDEQFLNKVKELDHSKAILVYCRSGGRSAKAAQQILSLGFKQVYNLEGGMMEWNNKKGPIAMPK
ncbi:MAG: hypothetical protein Kow0079_04180 [Vicingaceae bacterium]|jgi:rhodanese-related sulfurtransferase